MWALPTFEVELRLSHLGRVVRSRKCKITTPMGLRRSVNTALRVAIQNGTGIDLETLAEGWDAGDPWRCAAVVPRAFAERLAPRAQGPPALRWVDLMKRGLRRLLEDVKRELLSLRQAAEGNAEESRAERLDAMITGIDHHLERPPLCLCGHLAKNHAADGRCLCDLSRRGHVSRCDCRELRPVR